MGAGERIGLKKGGADLVGTCVKPITTKKGGGPPAFLVKRGDLERSQKRGNDIFDD